MSPATADHDELDRLLRLVATQIDPDRCREIDDRYLRALTCREVDRPPLVVKPDFGHRMPLPEPWSAFRRYSYRQTFDDPAAMLQNMLLERVAPGLALGDDSPLAIRNNHGTIQVPSALGAKWSLHEDNFPWVEPVEDVGEVALRDDDACLDSGVVPRSVATLKFYREALAKHPPCAEAIQVSLPDLQGPIDNADLLWGSDVFCAIADCSPLLHKLLATVTRTIVKLASRYRAYSHDRLDPAANTQHTYQVPGRLLIRNDSSIMLSPEMYAEVVRPYDAQLLHEMGGGSIHFCGNGQHLVEKMLEIPDLKGVDLGQPHLQDADAVYSACIERGVAVTNLQPSRSDLVDGTAARRYRTGAVLAYATDSFEDARDVVRRYKESAK